MRRWLHKIVEWLQHHWKWLVAGVIIPVAIFCFDKYGLCEGCDHQNSDPIVQNINVSPSRIVEISQDVKITVQAFDTDHDPLIYTWSCSEGYGLPKGRTSLSSVNWTAPAHSGDVTIYVTVSDNWGGVVKGNTVIQIVESSK